ncbi:MAG TPA: hypothetical protein ENK12_07000 [Gammaproteobacteria bacterium]|nr:hypothetical protein [Gammaproteobacteria bacterium]
MVLARQTGREEIFHVIRKLAFAVASGVVISMAWADRQAISLTADNITFQQLDSDRNGYVSRVEAGPVLGPRQAFDAADRNADGLLDPQEFALALPATDSR